MIGVLLSLTTFQFGFIKNRSTLQQLLVFYSEIFESSSAGSQSDVIYLDFAKAFDSVPHKELLFKFTLEVTSGSGLKDTCLTGSNV